MSIEKCCWNCIYDDLKQAYEEPCVSCQNHSNFKEYVPTNYDRIRNMSVEELARFLEAIQENALFSDKPMYESKWKQFLESEVTE